MQANLIYFFSWGFAAFAPSIRALSFSVSVFISEILTFDWTVRLTDIVMILAVIAGPILAALATEVYRRRKEFADRKESVFRSLMATRSATMSPTHVENLNLVETVFLGSDSDSRAVVDQWKVYLQHLGSGDPRQHNWGVRREDLIHDLLQKMSVAIGRSYDLSHIKSGVYYPSGYETEV